MPKFIESVLRAVHGDEIAAIDLMDLCYDVQNGLKKPGRHELGIVKASNIYFIDVEIADDGSFTVFGRK